MECVSLYFSIFNGNKHSPYNDTLNVAFGVGVSRSWPIKEIASIGNLFATTMAHRLEQNTFLKFK